MKANFLDLLATLPLPARADYPNGTPFVQAFTHGSMSVELFVPGASGLDQDIQQPHEQDELYVVQRGQSEFVLKGVRTSVLPGDVLFVPAGAVHRFENFSADFTTWVIFYGPTGGEARCP
jgi:mannose-6-phosphate isomerase-like protein (cupin superfamily)